MKKRFCNVSRKVMAIVMATALVVPTIALNPMEAKAVVYENPETLDCTGWWTAHTGGYAIDENGMNLSFDFQTYDSATGNHNTPVLVVYSADDGKVNGTNYVEYEVIRSDLYAWAPGDINSGLAYDAWTAAGHNKVEMYNPDWIVEGGTDYTWATWLAENKTGASADVVATKSGGYVHLSFDSNGIHGVYDIPVDSKKDVYVALTGELCKISNIQYTDYTGEVMDNPVWWSAKSKGYVVGNDGLNLTFKSKTDSSATKNWETPSLLVYNGTTNVVQCDGYSELGLIRSDLYGSKTNATDFNLTTDQVMTDESWTTWLAKNKADYVNCEVNANIVENNLIVIFNNAGVISTTTIGIDPTKEVYISVTGQNCKIKELIEVDSEEEIVNLLGAQIQTIEDSDSYNLGFVTTISKENFNNLNIKEMGVLLKNSANATSLAMVTGNDGDVIKKITTNYVAPIELLDDTQKNSDTYAFRTIVKGVSNLYKKYTAVPYVTYMDGEEEVTVYGDAITRTVHDGK